MTEFSENFRSNVLQLVEQIPKGKVVTYGQIAAACGSPRAARIVGGIAHFGNPKLPWQRVVKKDGSLAEGFPGGVVGHADALRRDGCEIIGEKVNMKKHQWDLK